MGKIKPVYICILDERRRLQDDQAEDESQICNDQAFPDNFELDGGTSNSENRSKTEYGCASFPQGMFSNSLALMPREDVSAGVFERYWTNGTRKFMMHLIGHSW